jgi:hypothetical protein
MCSKKVGHANGHFVRWSLIALLLMLLPAAALHAQAVSIASVTGRVVDEQGAVVSGAQIRMTGVDNGVPYSTVSNLDGIYTFLSLPIGAYRLESTVFGFQTYVQNGIQLRVNDQVQINRQYAHRRGWNTDSL